MKSLIRRSATPVAAIIAAFLLLAVVVAIIVVNHAGATSGQSQNGRLITIHDRGINKVIMSNAATVGDALKDAGVQLDSSDNVEPDVTVKLVASEYNINIYRARPVIVVDGATKQKIITPYQTADQIAKGAGITLYPEDRTTLEPSDDITADGVGLVLTINRAAPFTFTLYGTTTNTRTQARTVGAMLKEKGITLTPNDHVTPDQSTPLSSGLAVRVWREGKQTITVAEPVTFTAQKIQSGDYNVGYSAVQTSGVNGLQSVTYEVTIQDGKEVSRTPIASIVTVQPVQEVDIIGVKVALSRSYSADRVSVMTQAGIADSDQGYTAYIIDHENASWCPTRWQGQSGCPAVYSALYGEDANIGYGLCQATPGNKMATAGDDWRTNPVTQMKWCAQYAISRYGSWLAAYTFKVQKGWW